MECTVPKYSQNDEEDVIRKFFDSKGMCKCAHCLDSGVIEREGSDVLCPACHGNSTKVRFLDIGAYDGKTFSNTLALTERGWGGTLVEASPHAFIALKAQYKHRRIDAKDGSGYNLVQACLGFDWRLRKFWDSPDAVATDDPKHEEKWRSLGQYQEIMVPELPLTALLESCPGPYHFINIDVEGETTEKLFRAMPFRALGCRLVCVECNDDGERFHAIGKALNLKPIHQNGENIIFEVI